MKGNEKKTKEVKKAKSDGTNPKSQSEYQKGKTRKSSLDTAVVKPKK